MPRRTLLLLPTLALAFAVLPPAASMAAQGDAAPGAAPANTPATVNDASAALHALFERQWDWSARQFPEWATYRGDLRFNDRLTDASAEAEAARDRDTAGFLAQARAIRRDALSPTDRVSLDLFIDQQQRQLARAEFPAARHMSLRVLGGPQSDFAELMSVVPMQRPEHAAQALARMAAQPRHMDQQIDLLRASARAGWVPARGVLERALAQIDSQLTAQGDDSPHFDPFKRLGRDIPAAEQVALQAAARQAIAGQVLPALRRLRALVVDELMAKAPADGSLSRYPGGDAVYAMLVRQRTTTEMSPAQIHALGQRELARLRAEMEAVMRETRFEGGFAQFVHHLNTDARFIAAGPEALLAGYRDIAKRLDGELPRLFAELPRMPYGVLAMPAHMGANRAEYYSGPALDGSRAGFFYANTVSWRTRPTWGMETLVAHEAVPGHHLQIARASELRGLPAFRRSSWGYTAYTEGWALYAETLGFDLGLYTDPYSRFGHLMWQAFRAARLVVDTGIHQLGWPRQKAIDFMTERTGVDLEFVESEIDRYTSDPGQALAYMIGKLKFDELRDRAKARLGPRFDIRRFHNAVLDQGALPLNLLDRLADEWIAAEAARAP